MAQSYFKSHQDVDRALITIADEKLQSGYTRLIGFRCSKGGYDWFGRDPASEILTAYGILEFTEMSKVMTGVDMNMVAETIEWLLKSRDKKGTFKISTSVLHSWDTAQDIADAYILYSLTSAGVAQSELQTEIESLKGRLSGCKDPYKLALLANICFNIGDIDGGTAICDKLTSFQEKDGSIVGAKTTITQSGGKSLLLETTAFCVIAWLKDPNSDWLSFCKKGIKFIADNNTMGGYYNTQSTVLALQAIIAYDIRTSVPKAPGTLQLVINDKIVQSVDFSADRFKPVQFDDFSEHLLTPGLHTAEIRLLGGSVLSYALEVSYSAYLPDNDPECSVEISNLTISNTVISEGEGTEINLTVTNRSEGFLPMTIAIVGIPGGLELRHEKLKELVKSGQIAAYEVLGARRLVIYWRNFSEKESKSFSIDVVAAVPGKYTGPASCTYLYYTNEYKNWFAGLGVTINPIGN